MKYILLMLVIFIFSCGSDKNIEEKSNTKIEANDVIPDNVIKENIEKRFTGVMGGSVFDAKNNYSINVNNSKVELVFQVSEHYDYSSDEKLKQRMVIESIKLFDKIDGVQSVKFKTNYKNMNYTFYAEKSNVEDFIKNIGQRTNDDVMKLWNKYGSN